MTGRFRRSVREGPVMVMVIVSAGGACGRAGLRCWARLRGHLDILRLMTRGVDSQSSGVEPVQDLAGGFGDGGGQVFRGKKPPGR
jgi:hypothetical protein